MKDTQGCNDGEVQAALQVVGWDNGHRPDSLEGSVLGVFAIGDVRAGSVKRVAAAVGEGAAVVAQVHRRLAAQAARLAAATPSASAMAVPA